MRIYYACCTAMFRTSVKRHDLESLERIFPKSEIVDPDTRENDSGYRQYGIAWFKPIVESCGVFVFRALPGGGIPAGVAAELSWALDSGATVLEMPEGLRRRVVDRADTDEFIRSTKEDR